MSKRTNHADALHRAGEITKALELFQEAEQIQQKLESNYPRLYSLQGYYYGDMLLEQGRIDEVLERAEYALKIAKKNGWLLDIALGQLTLGRAHWQQGDFVQAADWLNLAVTGLRVAGRQDYLSRGLLARAALYRDTRNLNHDFARARQDLQEVYDIAEPSGMRLHLTDYHLEMARLLIAEKENPPQSPFFKGGSSGGDVVAIPPLEKGGLGGISVQEHVVQAAKLIEETGYKRRLPELQELQKRIGEQPVG